MKADTIKAFEEAIEGLLNFICDPREGGPRDQALRGLVKLRNELPNEQEAE